MKASNGAWAVTALIGSYVVCQAIADVSATKIVDLGGIVLPAGSMIFALTFTIRDLIHKRLGKSWARAAIVMAALFNVVQAIYFAWVASLNVPVFYQFKEAWLSIFAIVPAITVASIIAELLSELADTEVYHAWYERVVSKGAPQWTAVLVSNAVSLPLDSLIFGTLAFTVLPLVFGGESLPISAALTLVAGQIVWKAAVTVISMPGIYLTRRRSNALVVEV